MNIIFYNILGFPEASEIRVSINNVKIGSHSEVEVSYVFRDIKLSKYLVLFLSFGNYMFDCYCMVYSVVVK